jgi:hypothetical protein
VATPYGLYRSTSSGESFERLALPGSARENDVRDVVADPQRSSRIYVATGGGLFISKDGGGTFAKETGRVGDAPGLAVAAGVLDGTVHVLVGTENGLFRSSDGGEEFREMLLKGEPPFTGVGAVAIAPDGAITYAGTARGLYSGERGAPILEHYGGLPRVLVEAIAPDPRKPRSVAVGTRTRGVVASNDAGLTLAESSDNVPAAEVTAIGRPASDPVALWVATDRGLFRSVPGTGITIAEGRLQKLRAQWAQEPTLTQTIGRALDYGQIAPDAYAGMTSRAALAKVLPRMQVGYWYTYGTEEQTTYVLRAGDDLPPGVDQDNDNSDLFGNVGFFSVVPTTGERHRFMVTLTWDLDRLILNPDEIRAGRQGPYYHAAERRVVEHVQETYAARRRLMTEMSMQERAGKSGDAVLKQKVNQQF